MTTLEMQSLQPGTPVFVNVGRGWTQHGTFKKCVRGFDYGRHTTYKTIDFAHGKPVYFAECEFKENGKTETRHILARKVHVDKIALFEKGGTK